MPWKKNTWEIHFSSSFKYQEEEIHFKLWIMKARAEEYHQDSLYSFQFSINSSGKSIETMKIYARIFRYMTVHLRPSRTCSNLSSFSYSFSYHKLLKTSLVNAFHFRWNNHDGVHYYLYIDRIHRYLENIYIYTFPFER